MGARIELELYAHISANPNEIVSRAVADSDGLWFSDVSSVIQNRADAQKIRETAILDKVTADNTKFSYPTTKLVVSFLAHGASAIAGKKQLKSQLDVEYTDGTTTHNEWIDTIDKLGDTYIFQDALIEKKPTKTFTFTVSQIVPQGEGVGGAEISNVFVGIGENNSYDLAEGTDYPIELYESEEVPHKCKHPISTLLGVWSKGLGQPLECSFNFGKIVSTVGIEVEALAKTVTVEWYNKGNLVKTRTQEGTEDWHNYVFSELTTFDSIKIKTTSLNEYGIIDFVLCGRKIILQGDEIESCKILEQEDVTALTMPSNYCDLTVVSPIFNVWNDTVELKVLTENVPFSVYYDENDKSIFLGKFYTKEVKSLDSGSCQIRAYDLLSLLSQYKATKGLSAYGEFVVINGEFPNNVPMEIILPKLWEAVPNTVPISLIDYSNAYYSQPSCYIGESDVRTALTYLIRNLNYGSFYCSTSRSDKITVKRYYSSASKTYTEDDYFENPKITIEKKPTDVSIKVRDFHTFPAKYEEVFKGTVSSPTWIYFNDFANAVTLFKNNDVVEEEYATYSFLLKPTNTEVTLRTDTQSQIDLEEHYTRENTYTKQIEIDAHTTAGTIPSYIANDLFDFYSKEFVVDFETEFDDLLCGDNAKVVFGENTFDGVILQQEIDVTGGLLMKRKMRGSKRGGN